MVRIRQPNLSARPILSLLPQVVVTQQAPRLSKRRLVQQRTTMLQQSRVLAGSLFLIVKALLVLRLFVELLKNGYLFRAITRKLRLENS